MPLINWFDLQKGGRLWFSSHYWWNGHFRIPFRNWCHIILRQSCFVLSYPGISQQFLLFLNLRLLICVAVIDCDCIIVIYWCLEKVHHSFFVSLSSISGCIKPSITAFTVLILYERFFMSSIDSCWAIYHWLFLKSVLLMLICVFQELLNVTRRKFHCSDIGKFQWYWQFVKQSYLKKRKKKFFFSPSLWAKMMQLL